MSERRFDIVFDGSVINGADPLDVKANVKKLFKLDDTSVEKLFTGTPIAIKKSIDRKTATQYQTAMNKAGAKIQIVLHGAAAPQTGSPNPKQTPQADVSADEDRPSSLSVAASGSDLLNPSERAKPVNVSINTDHLSLEKAANPFLDALDKAPSPSQAEPVLPSYPAPEIDNAPAFDLTSQEVIEQQILKSTMEREAFIVEQSKLAGLQASVNEAGADLLNNEEKQQAVEIDIDTSQLSIDPI